MRMTSARTGLGLLAFLALAPSCSSTDATHVGGDDAGGDASVDAVRSDAAAADGNADHDSGFTDTGGAPDTGAADSGAVLDSSSTDTGAGLDTGTPDEGTRCKSAGDCPAHQACDVAAGVCTVACSSAQPCNGGCCSGGLCATGTGQTACGLTGATCATCVGAALGTSCTAAGTCGCTTASECPVDHACNAVNQMCGTVCSASEPCNGGCCNGAVCAPGTGQMACGRGPSCFSCAGLVSGSACLSSGACGCATATDCAPGQSCGAQGACTTCDTTTEVSFAGHCYYLDGSAGTCDAGYSLQSNASLAAILAANPNAWEGLTYRHTVSKNCCVGTSDATAEYGMTANCDTAGPFSAGQPIFNGMECNGYAFSISQANQLTLCGL